jgi:hypothetical protein
MVRVAAAGVGGIVAIVIASAATGCGALIGIEDGIADPGLDATSTDATSGDATTTDARNSDAAMIDSSPAVDAAPVATPIGRPGGDTTSLPCGTMTCPIPSESCCAYRSSTQPGLYTGLCATTCAPPSGTTDRVSVLKCSSAANCPSTAPRCCYHQASNGATETTCQTQCGSGSTDVMLCDPNQPNSCGLQRFCQHFTGNSMPPSWGYCN